MLTNLQKIQLKEILDKCLDEKLKLILERAIPKWISGEVIPFRNNYGIYVKDKNYIPLYLDNTCCLIGTALIGFKRKRTITEDAIEIFGLTEELLLKYISEFDNFIDNNSNNDTIVEIRKILFGR